MLSDDGLDLMFRQARTARAFRDEPVTEVLIRAVYDLTKYGPTSLNCCPARFVFVTTPQAKERLKPHLSPVNVEKTMVAPVCAIVAQDSQFYDKMATLTPARPEMGAAMAKNEALAEETAFRNSSLQGAYFILAARALGLDCGPMSGFDRGGVDRTFFPDGRLKSNFLCTIGYGDPAALRPRAPRLGFEEACTIL